MLVIFAITDSSHALDDWRTPYIYSLLIVGFLVLGAAAYVEGWVAEMPLLPFDLFRVPYMKGLAITLFFTYGNLGAFLLYATFSKPIKLRLVDYRVANLGTSMEDVMGCTLMQGVAWYIPMVPGGLALSTAGGFMLHLIPGTIVVIFAGVAWAVAPLMFATAPIGADYWTYVFPAMVQPWRST